MQCGKTSLELAVNYGQVEIVQCLVELEADINIINDVRYRTNYPKIFMISNENINLFVLIGLGRRYSIDASI